MIEFTLTPDEFGLVRMGRKRSIIRLFTAPKPGWEIRILNTEGPQHFEATITRVTFTTIRELTQEDAVKAGFLYLHQLQTALMDQPHITDDVPVSIFEFRCEGDE